ncbi:MAG: hypothetical protein PHY29_06560 [Syntrophales bacterium]|nr:hypothetical protein [Syntrophales bacterium]
MKQIEAWAAMGLVSIITRWHLIMLNRIPLPEAEIKGCCGVESGRLWAGLVV